MGIDFSFYSVWKCLDDAILYFIAVSNCWFYFRTIYGRMKTQLCGFMDLVPEQCLPFPLVRITVSKGRTNNLVDSDKLSSLRNNMGLWDIRTFTIPRQVYHWTANSKLSGTRLWEGLRVNNPSSRNRFGKTATNRLSVSYSSGQSEVPLWSGINLLMKYY